MTGRDYADHVVKVRALQRRVQERVRLDLLARDGEFHSMAGPMTGPERMEFARAVAYMEELELRAEAEPEF